MTLTAEIDSCRPCLCSGYAVAMPEDAPPTSGRTPGRVIRLSDELWDDYELACKAMGTNRSDDIRRHVTATVATWKREQRRAAREAAEGNES